MNGLQTMLAVPYSLFMFFDFKSLCSVVINVIKKKKKLSVASFVLDLVKNKVLFVSFAFGNISLPEQ